MSKQIQSKGIKFLKTSKNFSAHCFASCQTHRSYFSKMTGFRPIHLKLSPWDSAALGYCFLAQLGELLAPSHACKHRGTDGLCTSSPKPPQKQQQPPAPHGLLQHQELHPQKGIAWRAWHTPTLPLRAVALLSPTPTDQHLLLEQFGVEEEGTWQPPLVTPLPPTVSRRPLPVRRAPVGRAEGSRQGPRRQLDVDGEGLHGDPRSPTAPRPCPAPLAGSAAAAAGPSRPAPPPPCGCRTAVPGLPLCGRRVSVFSRNPEPVPGPEQERAPIFLVPHSQPQRPSRGSPRQCLGDEGRPLKLSVIPMP